MLLQKKKVTGGKPKMKTDIQPYKRLGDFGGNFGKTGGNKILEINFVKSGLILLPIAFLLGRISFFGGMMPFGIAIYGAAQGYKPNRLLMVACILGGMLTAGAREQIYVTAAAMLLFNALEYVLKKGKSKVAFRHAVTAFIGVLIPEMVMVYLQGFLLYDFLKGIFGAFIVFSLVFILKSAIAVITEGRRVQSYTSEEIISIAIISALALSGLGNISLFGFTIKNILSILVVLAFSYKCGAGVGAAAGVTVGLIASMSAAVSPLIIGTYAFCGLLSGVFGKLGKIGVSLGFVIGNAVLTLYMNGSIEVLVHLKEITAAILVFLLIPQKAIDMTVGRFDRTSENGQDKGNYSSRIKEMTVDRLNRFSKAFKELAGTFSEISETKVVTNKQDISVLFDRVADRVCKDCSLCLHCWDRNFYNTYQVLFKIVERLDVKGRIEENDIPSYFLDRCERVNDFVEAVNSIYEIFKVDMVWKSRIGESRGLVSQQLEGLSRVISNLASEIDVNVRFNGELEDRLVEELKRAGVKANEAIVVENKWGKYEISIFHKGCGGKRSCISVVEELVSKSVGRKMVKEGPECHKASNGSCTLRLVEEEAFRVTTGIAKVSKQNNSVSGDNYTFMNTGEGKYIVALSDGMGSGQKAAMQSKATVSLLEQFMEAGFDKDITVKLINSILVLRSNDDSFATIDLSVIDLYEGSVEFVKIGAVPTFIKRNGSVEAVRNVSLPAGILSNIEVELMNRSVESGEFIIMMTDGIPDAFQEGGEDGIKLLQGFIQELKTINPQEIADSILREAYSRSGGEPFDDMTVMVSKVWKKPN